MFFKLVDSHECARYKKGDTVVIKKGEAWDGTSLEGKFVKILGVRVWFNGVTTYKIDHDSDYGLEDEEIDHEVTRKLNIPIKEEVKPIDLLENGCVVEFRNGERALVLKGGELQTMFEGNQEFCLIKESCFWVGSVYNELLESQDFCKYDIMKIYKRNICDFECMIKSNENNILIWQRPEPKPYKVTASEILRLLNLKEGTKIEVDLER